MPKSGSRRKKARTHNLKDDAEDEIPSGPCSFVVKKGRVDKELSELVSDFRQLMSPNTYSRLQNSKQSTAQDYVHVAGSLGATHLLRISQNDKNVARMQMSRLPAGPSFEFKIDQMSLISDIRKQVQSGGIGLSREDERFPPVAILNGFKAGEVQNECVSLLCEALKGLISPIDIDKLNMKTCRRVVLFSYSGETDSLSIRHYRITLAQKHIVTTTTAVDNSIEPSALCGVVLNARTSARIPDLSQLVSISDLIVPDKIPGGPAESLRLVELGPRVDASLARVVSGVEQGTVLYSKFAPESVGTVIVKKLPKRSARRDITKKKVYRNENENNDMDEFSE